MSPDNPETRNHALEDEQMPSSTVVDVMGIRLSGVSSLAFICGIGSESDSRWMHFEPR